MKIQNLNKAVTLSRQYEETLDVMDVLSRPDLCIVLFRSPTATAAEFTLNNEEQKEVTEQMVDLMRGHFAKKLKGIKNQIEEL